MPHLYCSLAEVQEEPR